MYGSRQAILYLIFLSRIFLSTLVFSVCLRIQVKMLYFTSSQFSNLLFYERLGLVCWFAKTTAILYTCTVHICSFHRLNQLIWNLLLSLHNLNIATSPTFWPSVIRFFLLIFKWCGGSPSKPARYMHFTGHVKLICTYSSICSLLICHSIVWMAIVIFTSSIELQHRSSILVLICSITSHILYFTAKHATRSTVILSQSLVPGAPFLQNNTRFYGGL